MSERIKVFIYEEKDKNGMHPTYYACIEGEALSGSPSVSVESALGQLVQQKAAELNMELINCGKLPKRISDKLFKESLASR